MFFTTDVKMNLNEIAMKSLYNQNGYFNKFTWRNYLKETRLYKKGKISLKR